MDALVLRKVTITINVLNVLLHSTGIYLLWKIYVWKEITTQQLLIFSLKSIAEGLLSTLYVVLEVLNLTSNYEYTEYVLDVAEALLTVIYLIMLFMTVDRLMAVVLSWKYKVYWRVGRTKKVLAVVWLLGIMWGVCSALLRQFLPLDLRSVFINAHRYLEILFSLIFIAIALLTYVIIYWKHKKSGRLLRNHRAPNENSQQQSTRQQSHKLRSYIPGLIIFTYLICNIIPLIINLKIAPYLSNILLKIIFYLGYTCDAFIYIFLQEKVRNQLFGCCKRQSRSERSNNAETNVESNVSPKTSILENS